LSTKRELKVINLQILAFILPLICVNINEFSLVV
jgi:hypothetical protein